MNRVYICWYFCKSIKLYDNHITLTGIMCHIPGTWHDSSSVIFTVEEFCQHRKKKKSARDCWRIVPVTVEQSCLTVKESCQPLLNNRTSNCWTIVQVTVEQSCQWLLRNRASDCWIIVPVTVEEFCQWQNNRASDCWTILPATVEHSRQCLSNNGASDCWTIVPATVEQSCQWLLNNLASVYN